MKKSKSIQLKAALLLTVFALNTVVAFACSLGLNMGFNQKHHHNENEDQTSSSHSHHHPDAIEEHHEHGSGLHHQHQKGATNKDGCCNNKAVKIQQIDKTLPHGSNPVIKAPVFVAFLSAFLGLKLKNDPSGISSTVLIRQYYPPPDIRIAIHSFQI